MSSLVSEPTAAQTIEPVVAPQSLVNHRIIGFLAQWLGPVQQGQDDIFFSRREHSIGLCTALQHYLHEEITEGNFATHPHTEPDPNKDASLLAKCLIALTLAELDVSNGIDRSSPGWLQVAEHRALVFNDATQLHADVCRGSGTSLPHLSLLYLRTWQLTGSFNPVRTVGLLPGAFEPI